jgi:hypothetical protein
LKPILVLFVWLLAGVLAPAQVITSRLSGTVTDPQGALIQGATVTVVNDATGAKFTAATSAAGDWDVPALDIGSYTVTISAKGFKTAVIPHVVLEVNTPATANVKLELGAVTETVNVTGGAQVMETQSATVSSTLTGKQINELPFASRNALDLAINQAGTSTPGTQVTSSVNGLPQSSVNTTLDGVNIQDSLLKSESGNGFLAWMMPRTDSTEEVTMQSTALDAASSGDGATQIRFVTKSGTNDFHGGAFWQNRNSFFDANYYFNNEHDLPRDRINLNQFGFDVGGPIKHNRLFFFASDEELRLPQSANSSATLLTSGAMGGVFTYLDTTKQVRSVNLLTLAAQYGFPSTADPTVSKILSSMASDAAGRGTFISDIATSSDYNRDSYYFQIPANFTRHWPTMRLDAILNSKNVLDFIYHYQSYDALPDVLNGYIPVLPNTGTVLNTSSVGQTRRLVYSPSASLRSTITPRLTSEAMLGMQAGSFVLNEPMSPGLFSQWKGYAPGFNGYVTNPYTVASQSRRNEPVWNAHESLSWVRGAHLVSFGGTFEQVNLFQQTVGTASVPQVTFGIATNDPVDTGNTSFFTAANFPNINPTDLSNAEALYADLTGRVSSITQSANLNPATHQYGPYAATDNVRQREFGLYAQDSWKVAPRLTLNYGLRWEVQTPFTNPTGSYTEATPADIWGVSGVGNLFQPGYMPGINPEYRQTTGSTPAFNPYYKGFEPSMGIAWQSPGGSGILKWLLGEHGVVVRGGYSISTIREGLDTFVSNGWGSNQGRTLTLNVTPGNNPTVFGAPGSVLFSNPALPSMSYSTAPSYPIPAAAGDGIYGFDPNLRPGYVQSWDLGVQRELAANTVLEVRYVGNHGTDLWEKININEVNIYENGFLSQFDIAQNNLLIAQQASPTSTNWGDQGLAGQQPIPMISTALGGTTTGTTNATYIQQGQAGRLANTIATNATDMANLTKAGYPANLFLANPAVGSALAMEVMNLGNSTYNGLQVELRRRLASGLEVQGSYVFAKALTDCFATSSRSGTGTYPTTLRNLSLDKGPSPWDMRNDFKVNWIYQLPFGPQRRFLGSAHNGILRKAVEGWSLAAVTRVQSGTPELLRSGRQVVNANGNGGLEADGGVILENMTAQQLNSMVHITKTGNGLVYYLPQSLVNNTMAAFDVGGLTPANLDAAAPYIAPPATAGKLGYRIFLYGPWQEHFDASLIKTTRIGEKVRLEFRAQCLNVFNTANFLLGDAGTLVNTPTIGASFAQTTSAYRDFTIAGTSNPGSRVLEWQTSVRF